ncbi:16S rRNA (cytosine(1402)-N(4))-methyltransferase RsmH [Ruminococcaceae bacterium OttesenSCG-928-D13]|nr:16S rRNA (cytosine(1402)-N(4))-methyltransferase RsmH [Ruminococcaceae bacterium OttesenSCG-928-D13]
MDFSHEPVMLAECLAALDIKPDGVYVDGTAGGGGHSAAIAGRLTGGRLYAFDQDPDAIAAAGARLEGLPAQLVRANFRNAATELAALGVEAIDGALLDLGVSSHQLDSARRGFSYHADAPLDMRMSQSGPTAADLVNTLDRQALADILREYGEEQYAWQIAGKLEATRAEAPVETTGRLAEIIISAVPPAVRRKQKNPARKSFQALRIAVNGELDALSEGLDALFGLLNPGGRLAVISFHSLEDRLVKQRFKGWATACTCPPELPVCVCGGVAKAKLVGKNPIVAAEDEQERNRRSRSAKLRVIEKL